MVAAIICGVCDNLSRGRETSSNRFPVSDSERVQASGLHRRYHSSEAFTFPCKGCIMELAYLFLCFQGIERTFVQTGWDTGFCCRIWNGLVRWFNDGIHDIPWDHVPHLDEWITIVGNDYDRSLNFRVRLIKCYVRALNWAIAVTRLWNLNAPKSM